jgi:hypothetical protein
MSIYSSQEGSSQFTAARYSTDKNEMWKESRRPVPVGVAATAQAARSQQSQSTLPFLWIEYECSPLALQHRRGYPRCHQRTEK